MPPSHVTRRRGPLAAVEGTVPGVAIGDTSVRHARLTTDGLSLWLGDVSTATVPWVDVQAVHVEPPRTWWPHPAVGDSIGPILEGLLGGGASETLPATPTFPMRVAAAGRDIVEWRLTQHYLSGYRPRDARVTTRLVDYLVERPESRRLLAQPAELLDRISALLRARPRIAE